MKRYDWEYDPHEGRYMVFDRLRGAPDTYTPASFTSMALCRLMDDAEKIVAALNAAENGSGARPVHNGD